MSESAVTFSTPDLYDDFGSQCQSCETQFLQFGARRRFAGPLRTVRCLGDNALVKQLFEQPSMGDANRPCGLVTPRFRNLPGGPKTDGFVRGYAYSTSVGAGFNFGAPGIGEAYKRAVTAPRPATVTFSGFGECLPYEDNVCMVDRDTLDAFGIPVVRMRLTPRDNEQALHRDMSTHAAEILERIGARNIRQTHGMRGQAHEVGAARMGTDPKTSVLTPFLQTHDVANLFVMDGSSFPSSAWQNPTLTIMALAVRSTDFLLERLRRAEI